MNLHISIRQIFNDRIMQKLLRGPATTHNRRRYVCCDFSGSTGYEELPLEHAKDGGLGADGKKHENRQHAPRANVIAVQEPWAEAR